MPICHANQSASGESRSGSLWAAAARAGTVPKATKDGAMPDGEICSLTTASLNVPFLREENKLNICNQISHAYAKKLPKLARNPARLKPLRGPINRPLGLRAYRCFQTHFPHFWSRSTVHTGASWGLCDWILIMCIRGIQTTQTSCRPHGRRQDSGFGVIRTATRLTRDVSDAAWGFGGFRLDSLVLTTT